MEEQIQLVKQFSIPMFQAKGWLRLLGVVMIIQGIFTALSIIGIIIAWLPIWLGVLLFQAASAVENAQLTGDKRQLLTSLEKIKMYFIINGILMVILLVIVAITIFTMGLGIFSAIMGGGY